MPQSNMHRMIRFAPALAILALAACNDAPEPAEEAVPEISLELMQEMTKTLASDEFEGREPGTPGEEKTIAYLIEQFEAAGLQPGNGGEWTQDVPLVEITGSSFAPLTVGDMAFDFGSEWVGVTYREEARTELADSEIVFVGYGINAPERGWNDYQGVDMRGKTALILVNDPDYAEEGLDGPFNGRAMTYYGRWTYKYEEAARQGAAAAIIVHEEFPASYPWSVVESSWSGAQAYAERADGGADQTQVNAWVHLDAAKQIASAAGKDFAELSAAAAKKGFKPVPLGLKASTSFDNAIRKFASKNVIGILPGSERPDEYVLHTAHWDHLGRCKPDESGDDICNGAIDNATGTAGLAAIAKAHAEAGAPARSLVFLAVTAEESGLLGAQHYGNQPVYPLAQTVGGVNLDALLMLGAARDVTVIGGGKSALDGYLETALAAQGRSATPDPSPQAGMYYRSDHFALAKNGVPMFYIKSGQDLLDGGAEAGQAARDAYYAGPYHAPSDEYSEDWDWSGVMQDLELFYRLGRALAQSEGWPNWNEGDEFRRIRDESCKGEGGC